jgi:hypothetical protein
MRNLTTTSSLPKCNLKSNSSLPERNLNITSAQPERHIYFESATMQLGPRPSWLARHTSLNYPHGLIELGYRRIFVTFTGWQRLGSPGSPDSQELLEDPRVPNIFTG